MEDRSIPSAGRIGPDMLGYRWDDLEEIPYLEAQKTKTTVNNRIDQPYDPDQTLRIDAQPFKTFDFGTDLPDSSARTSPSRLPPNFTLLLTRRWWMATWTSSA